MGFPGTVEEVQDEQISGRGVMQSFASPSTLPHLLVLTLNSGLLFAIMKAGIFGLQEKGSTMFLSLTLAYCIAAVIAPSSIGKILFKVQDKGSGILNLSYWKKSLLSLLPTLVICLVICLGILSQVDDKDLIWITYLLASIFVLMSIGQALSLLFGGIVYARKISKYNRPGRVGRHYTLTRSIFSVVVFSPLVWWFGYDAGGLSGHSVTVHLSWASFLGVIILVCVSADKLSGVVRESGNIDGIAADRMMMLMTLTTGWHILSSWRRNPFLVDSASGAMLLEEGALMAITILLAIWSMANRGHDKGWSIFQGQSAVFWGIAFGYAYGGSISSLTAISEGNLLTTTAGGHLLTALVMLVILPLAVTKIGSVGENDPENEATEVIENQSLSRTSPMKSTQNPDEVRTSQVLASTEFVSQDEDVVELID